jgi:antitoxin component YwqK of YwqJK toxin-antitoxin module/tetratricopeptide (TPR) repeat protein
MKIFFSNFLVFFLLLASQTLFSQTDSLAGKTSEELIDKAIEYHDKSDYVTAIQILQKISPCDPEYARACYEMGLSYYYSGDTDKALAKCREAEFLHYDEPSVYSLTGSIFDDMEKPGDGIVILNKALQKWPFNTNLLYNLGVCYLNAGDPVKAEEVLLKGLRINPFHAKSHMAVAKANYAMGRIAQSYLAFNMAILISPGLKNLREFDNAITGRLDVVPRSWLYPYPAGYDHVQWDKSSALLQAEFAFKDDFEYPYDLNYTISKQSYILLSSLQFSKSDTSFYNSCYAQFFTDMIKTGYLELYLHFLLKNTGSEEVATWMNNNTVKVNDFISHSQVLINSFRASAFSIEKKEENISFYHFDDDGNLASIGNMDGDEHIKNGDFIELNEDGDISQKGKYVNDKIEGEWLILWPNGAVKQRLSFHDGLLDGECYTYYPNGAKSGFYPMKAGHKNGKVEEYTASGNLISVNSYSDDVLNGPVVFNDFGTGFTRVFSYTKDTIEGRHTETWMNGMPKQESKYVKGNYEGKFSTWYINGKPEVEYNYVHGVKTGKYSKYHFNGALEESGEYDSDGNLTGEYKSFDRNGNIISVQREFTNGLLNGTCIEYFPDGKEQRKRIYKLDSLKRIESFNSKGITLYDAEESGNEIYSKIYYADGILRIEGKLVNGESQGSWKKYNPLGLLIEDYIYDNGLLSGSQKTYFANGTLKEEYGCDSNNITGIYKKYRINGHPEMFGQYSKEGRSGEWRTYHSNDTLESRSFYVNGVLVGRLLNYGPDGKITTEEIFNKDGETIRSIVYDHSGSIIADLEHEWGSCNSEINYPGGQPKAKISYCDNLLHGIQTSYFPNGELAGKSDYRYGKPEGNISTYDHNGNLMREFPYLFGELNGQGKWYEDGKLVYTADFEKGQYQGKCKGYYSNGKISRELNFSDDERNGYADYFAPDGNFMYRLKFMDAVLIAFTYKDKTGKIMPDIAIDKNTKQIVAYYPNGKVAARFGLKNGLYQGEYLSFYITGVPLRESLYDNDDASGLEKSFYPSGITQETINYINDDRSGTYCLYYENGKKKLEGNYIANTRYGEWHVYNKDGRETETLLYNNGDIDEIIAK